MPTKPPAFAKKPFHFDASDDDAADRYRFTAKPKGDGLEVTWASGSGSGKAKGKISVAAETLEKGRKLFVLSQGAQVGAKNALPPFLLSRLVFAELVSKKNKSKLESLLTGKLVEVSVVHRTTCALRIGGEPSTRAVLEVRGDDLHLLVLDDATWPFVIWRDDDDNGWHLVAQGADEDDAAKAKLSDLVKPMRKAAKKKLEEASAGPALLARFLAGEGAEFTLAEDNAVATQAASLPFEQMRAVFVQLAEYGRPALFQPLRVRFAEPGFVRALLAWYFGDADNDQKAGLNYALASIDNWHKRFDVAKTADVELLVNLYRQSDQWSLNNNLLRCFSKLRTPEALALFLELAVDRAWHSDYGPDYIVRAVIDDLPAKAFISALIAVLPRANMKPKEWQAFAWDFRGRLPAANARRVLEAIEKTLRPRKDAASFDELLSTLYDVG